MKHIRSNWGGECASVLTLVLALFLLPLPTGEMGEQTSAAAGGKNPPAKLFFIVAPERFHETLKDYVAHKEKLMPTE